MCQILFRIPLKSWFGILWDVPINGYGFMLFLGFALGFLMAVLVAKSQGIGLEVIQDLAIWLLVPGLIGARIMFILTEWEWFLKRPLESLAIWDGGLVMYGSVIGGFIGVFGAYKFILKPRGISAWRVLDIVAPAMALGLCLGRIGCLLNGCCFGHYAGEFPAVSFPLPTEPRKALVRKGLQTPAGFLVDRHTLQVTRVQPNSPAATAGLQKGDVIRAVNGKPVLYYAPIENGADDSEPRSLVELLVSKWPRGKNELRLTVQRGQSVREVIFTPQTIGLHPTQVYETVSTGLLVFLLFAYYPLRQREGDVMALLMAGYGLHRFLNEQIRNDTPGYPPLGFTLSQYLSIVLLIAAAAMFWWQRQKPAQPLGLAPVTGSPARADPEAALQD